MVVFIFSISSISDVITNSSSELFVFDNTDNKNYTKKSLKELLDKVYPNWKKEYIEPEIVKNYDDEDLKWFYDWYKTYEGYESEWIDRYNCSEEKFNDIKKTDLLDETRFAKLMELTPEECYSNWNDWNPSKRLSFKETPIDEIHHYHNLELSDEGLQKFREFCKKSGFIALLSREENPDFKGQEKLLSIASKKYHLG